MSRNSELMTMSSWSTYFLALLRIPSSIHTVLTVISHRVTTNFELDGKWLGHSGSWKCQGGRCYSKEIMKFFRK